MSKVKQPVQQNIEHLNTDCICITLNRAALSIAMEEAVGDPAFCRELALAQPNLLSAQPMFLSTSHAERMQQIVSAIDMVVSLSGYQSAVLAHAPEIARYRPGPIGVFMGYDFHLSPEGPKLIEINTNAGGALINAYLLQAQRACCTPMTGDAATQFDLTAVCNGFMASFEGEWERQGRTAQLRTIAIVDHAPRGQYLYPEFVLFQRLFEKRGIAAVIVSPEELSHRDDALWHGSQRIDLVYNRLTDFDLSQPESQPLRNAYLAGDVVVTPNPRAHALYADKRNLALLTDQNLLRKWSVAEDVIDTLSNGIPKTVVVTRDHADDLWTRRDKLFFKPSSGYGSKAAYRGDKLTRKVWTEILSASYVAQAIVPPSARTISIDGKPQSMKADLRTYVYAGKVQLLAARLFQGQTTNFRTPGGGFAPVIVGNTSVSGKCS